MNTYEFTYRRVGVECFHCKRKKFSFFTKKKEECELEWKTLVVKGHGPENYTDVTHETVGGNTASRVIEATNKNKMILFFEDGSLRTISDWENCELKLGTDWVLFTKKNMEKESGQNINLDTN